MYMYISLAEVAIIVFGNLATSVGAVMVGCVIGCRASGRLGPTPMH